jgi:hypothetical protein
MTETKTVSPLFLLYQQLCTVALTWSQMTFVYHSDVALQQQVTVFLVEGISILIHHRTENTDRSNDNHTRNATPVDITTSSYILHYTTLSTHLIDGVTHRLSSNQMSIRKDGMYIGQQLASLLGQPNLQFEELDESATEAHEVPRKSSDTPDLSTRKDRNSESKYGNSTDQRSSDENGDSDWDEDDDAPFEPYDIEDDRQDLRTVPQPLYLSECLEYLHTPDSEDNVCYRHEAVLHGLSRLVRTRPADLGDYGPELARCVLRLENKFNMDNFAELVAGSLCALVAEDPLAVGIHLIAELFEDGTLRDRLTILHALDDAAFELSGYQQLEDSDVESRSARQ